jgi:D-arabinose 5-phosphate isomerase GutQ
MDVVHRLDQPEPPRHVLVAGSSSPRRPAIAGPGSLPASKVSTPHATPGHTAGGRAGCGTIRGPNARTRVAMPVLTDFALEVIRREAEGLRLLEGLVDDAFARAVDAIVQCRGHVVVTGVGKPWLIGQKISATLASTGTPSFALHPSEAVHGDLGRLRAHDVLLVLSNSGESEEVSRLLPLVVRMGCRVIGISSRADSTLARHSDLLLRLPAVPEACPIGMAPSVSTTAMLALGDALALTVM